MPGAMPAPHAATPAPAPSMPQFGGFNLPGPGPTTGQQMGNAMGALPGMLNQEQQDKYKLQEQKAEAEALQQQQDMARIKLAVHMQSSASAAGLQVSPEVIKSAETAAKSLGIGSFMHVDPATGQQVFDWGAAKKFSSSKDWSDLTDAEKKEIYATPKSARKAKILGMNVDPDTVDKSILDAPVEMDEYKKSILLNRISTQFQNYAAGKTSMSGVQTEMALVGNELDDIGVDRASIAAVLDTPAFRNDMSKGYLLQAQKLQQLGVHEQNLDAFMKAKMSLIPYEIGDIINRGQNRDANTNLRADSIANAKTNADRNYGLALQRFSETRQRDAQYFQHLALSNQKILAGIPVTINKGQAATYDAVGKRWQAEYSSITKQLNDDAVNGITPDPALMAQQSFARDQVNKYNQMLTTLVEHQHWAPAIKASLAGGKTVTPAKPYTPAPGIVPPPDANQGGGTSSFAPPTGSKSGWFAGRDPNTGQMIQVHGYTTTVGTQTYRFNDQGEPF